MIKNHSFSWFLRTSFYTKQLRAEGAHLLAVEHLGLFAYLMNNYVNLTVTGSSHAKDAKYAHAQVPLLNNLLPPLMFLKVSEKQRLGRVPEMWKVLGRGAI